MINGLGNSPLSTQVIRRVGDAAAQNPQAGITPEDVNRAVGTTQDRLQNAQAAQEATQTSRRSAAADIYTGRSQQQQLDTYLAVALEGDAPSSNTLSLTDANDIRNLINRNDAISNLPEQDAGQRLQDLVERLAERPSTLPAVDEQA